MRAALLISLLAAARGQEVQIVIVPVEMVDEGVASRPLHGSIAVRRKIDELLHDSRELPLALLSVPNDPLVAVDLPQDDLEKDVADPEKVATVATCSGQVQAVNR